MFIQHAQLQHTFYTHRLPRTAGQISQQNACCVSLGATAYSPEPTGKSWHGSMLLVNSAQGRWVDMGGFLGLPGRPTSLNLPCVFQARERACLKNKTGGTQHQTVAALWSARHTRLLCVPILSWTCIHDHAARTNAHTKLSLRCYFNNDNN